MTLASLACRKMLQPHDRPDIRSDRLEVRAAERRLVVFTPSGMQVDVAVDRARKAIGRLAAQ